MDRADKPWNSTELERLIFLFQAMEEMPKIDTAKFADLIGQNKAAASMALSRLKAKLQHRRTNNTTTVSLDVGQSSSKAPVTPKKATLPANAAHDAVEEPKTPVSTGRKRKAKNVTPTGEHEESATAKGRKKKGRSVVKQEDGQSDLGTLESAAEMADADEDDMNDQAFLNGPLFDG